MKTCNRADVYAAIDDERKYQNLEWGSIEDHPHEVGAWLTIMRSILTDAESAWSSLRGDNGALDELRKLAAVGVACMEQHGVVPRSRLCFMDMKNGERCGK